jgi:hypothetical protein
MRTRHGRPTVRPWTFLAIVATLSLLASTTPANAVVVTASVAPDPPTHVQASPLDSSATVTWSPPSSDGGDPISSYTVTSSPDGQSIQTPDGATTAATVSGLTNGTAYTFTVHATNGIGSGSESAPSSAVTPTPTIQVEPLSGSLSAAALVDELVGSGVQTSNETYTGADQASGKFSSGDVVGFDKGVLLSSGSASNVVGRNDVENKTTDNGLPGDADLNALAPGTQDASVLEFDFVPQTSPIYFSYVFSSEEYNEYVGHGFNDVFGFFVNGTNCATVPGTTDTPVSIDTINAGSHADLFRNNSPDNGPPPYYLQMDGLTEVLTCQADVTPGTTNHMKLAIADVGDANFDSAVFLDANSLSTTPPQPSAPTNVRASAGNAEASVTWDAPDDPGSSPISSYTVTSSPEGLTTQTPDGSTTQATVTGLTNGQSYTFTVHASNDAGDGPESDPSGTVTPTGGEAAPDLRTTLTDTPDPVNGANKVLYEATVTNIGGTATTASFTDDPPPEATLDSFTTDHGTCGETEEHGVSCDLGSLGPNESAVVDVVVIAPDVGATTNITDTATASSAEDTNPSNDQATEDTQVDPRSPGQSAGYLPPEGGSINTDTGPRGPDPTDPTLLRLRAGQGPGGTGALTELDCAPPYSPCIGNVGDFVPPDGYDHLVAVLLFDGSIDPGRPKRQFDVFYQKHPTDPIVALPRCGGVLVPPCILQVKRILPQNWLRVRVLINSDPRVVTR